MLALKCGSYFVHIPNEPLCRLCTLHAYYPKNITSKTPVIIFLPGGGFVFSSNNKQETMCEYLSQRLQYIILCLQYPLSPEHKFPMAYIASQAVCKHILNTKEFGFRSIILWGESSGGNLVASISKHLKAKKHNIAFQVLISPSLDYYNQYQSKDLFGDGYLLDTNFRTWLAYNYLNNDEERTNPIVSPVLSSTIYSSPPTIILVGGLDPLKDEGLAYAEKLQLIGVDVNVIEYKDMIHCFSQYINHLSSANEALEKIFDIIKTKI